MKRYILSPEAKDDLQDIRAHYLTNADARVARHILGKITSGFRFLAATPGAGHSRADLTTEPMKFWQVSSYLIVYDAAVRPMGIARVLHSSRDLESLFRDRPPRV